MNAKEFRNRLGTVYLVTLGPTFTFWMLDMFPGWLALTLFMLGLASIIPAVIVRARRVKAIERGEYWEIDDKKDAA